MDDRRFDALARGLATARNRRQLLKGLLGLGGVAAATSLDSVQAARRPEPTPKPVTCPGRQTWQDGQCVCPDGNVKCGPACCTPGISECCDNACCYGTCYGEELCCPTGRIVCNGACRDWECCSDEDCPASNVCNQETHTCQCVPNCDGAVCGSDGCDGQCGTCGALETCVEGDCVCAEGAISCEGACREWDCCTNNDCPGAEVCNPGSHTCQCVPNCTGKTCGGDGCGGQCGTCPTGQTCTSAGACACASGVLCSDGACRQCCGDGDCAATFGGDSECSTCFQGICGYFSGFCTGGVCGISSDAVVGHCIECGVGGTLGGDSCSASVPCCSGYTCDFRFGDQGVCFQPA